MKKAQLFLISLIISLTSCGQQPVETFDSGDYIKPTMTNLTMLISLPLDDWEKQLKQLGYTEFSRDSESIIYLKGVFGERFQTITRYPDQEGMHVYWYNTNDKVTFSQFIKPDLPETTIKKTDERKYYKINYQGNEYVLSLIEHEKSEIIKVKNYEKGKLTSESEYEMIIEEVQIFSENYMKKK